MKYEFYTTRTLKDLMDWANVGGLYRIKQCSKHDRNICLKDTTRKPCTGCRKVVIEIKEVEK